MNKFNTISKVMNNRYLRWIILSYLRKEPKIICMFCKNVCVWDVKVKNYYQVPNYYYNISNSASDELYKKKINIYCQDCISNYRPPTCEII